MGARTLVVCEHPKKPGSNRVKRYGMAGTCVERTATPFSLVRRPVSRHKRPDSSRVHRHQESDVMWPTRYRCELRSPIRARATKCLLGDAAREESVIVTSSWVVPSDPPRGPEVVHLAFGERTNSGPQCPETVRLVSSWRTVCGPEPDLC